MTSPVMPEGKLMIIIVVITSVAVTYDPLPSKPTHSITYFLGNFMV